jgi:hypothetical protein
MEINLEYDVTHIVRNTILRLCNFLTNCSYAVRNIIIHLFTLFDIRLYFVRFYNLRGCSVM